jgi:two-component system capsular synthesis sensor histidine kinase RcsC
MMLTAKKQLEAEAVGMCPAVGPSVLRMKRQHGECLDGRTAEKAKRILVVDDEEAIRGALFDIISFMGFDVTVAHNGDQGLSLFLERTFDLVLTDFQMPGLDGWDLAKCIKTTSQDTPVVLITGQDRKAILSKIEESDFDAILFKPFTLEELEETFRRF